MSSKGRTLVLLTALVAIICAGLGVWQLRRLAARRARNQLAVQAQTAAPIDLNATGLSSLADYRRAAATGEYDFDHELVIRGRLLEGTPGVQIVTPLRIAGRDTALLINRGFVPSPDAGYPPAGTDYQEPAEARINGPVLRVPDAGDGQPVSQPRGETWYRLDLSAMRARLPYPIAPFYLIATADSSTPEHTARGRTLPIRISLPPLDNGPHLSYAIQWFLIGGAALGFGLTFGRRQRGPTPR